MKDLAFLKKWLSSRIDKATFLLISGLWSAGSSVITYYLTDNPVIMAFITTAGNLFIAWLATETSSNEA